MKFILTIIVLAAIITGGWQAQELSRLTRREAALHAASVEAATPAETNGTKSSHREDKPDLDPAGFIALLGSFLEKGVPPTAQERASLRERIESASGRDLKRLALAIRDSQLPQEMKNEILAPFAPRLAEHDPALAAELALAGDEGITFRSVLRSWLITDPSAAAAWLEQIEPPRFRNPGDIDLAALSTAARVAADPSAIDGLLASDEKATMAALTELVVIQGPPDLARVLRRLSLESPLPESTRCQLIGDTLARHRDPVVARQVLLDAALPADQFAKAAAILIGSLDPVGKEASIAWAKSLSDPRQREDLLRVLETADGR